tara:strand:- start:167 stop:304 length:138 start_codon:yes stop_codon:yes gene_type:complete
MKRNGAKKSMGAFLHAVGWTWRGDPNEFWTGVAVGAGSLEKTFYI